MKENGYTNTKRCWENTKQEINRRSLINYEEEIMSIIQKKQIISGVVLLFLFTVWIIAFIFFHEDSMFFVVNIFFVVLLLFILPYFIAVCKYLGVCNSHLVQIRDNEIKIVEDIIIDKSNYNNEAYRIRCEYSGQLNVTREDFTSFHTGDRIFYLLDRNNEIFQYRFLQSKTIAAVSYKLFSERICYLSDDLRQNLFRNIPNGGRQGSGYFQTSNTNRKKFLITFQWLFSLPSFKKYFSKDKRIRILDEIIVDKYQDSSSEGDSRYMVACNLFPPGVYVEVDKSIYSACGINTHAFIFESFEGRYIGLFPSQIFDLDYNLKPLVERYSCNTA